MSSGEIIPILFYEVMDEETQETGSVIQTDLTNETIRLLKDTESASERYEKYLKEKQSELPTLYIGYYLFGLYIDEYQSLKKKNKKWLLLQARK